VVSCPERPDLNRPVLGGGMSGHDFDSLLTAVDLYSGQETVTVFRLGGEDTSSRNRVLHCRDKGHGFMVILMLGRVAQALSRARCRVERVALLLRRTTTQDKPSATRRRVRPAVSEACCESR
jgi:hypothetical protein